MIKTVVGVFLAAFAMQAQAGLCKVEKVGNVKSITCKRVKSGVTKAYRAEITRDAAGRIVSVAHGPVTMLELTVKMQPDAAGTLSPSAVSLTSTKPADLSANTTVGVGADGSLVFK